MFNPIEVANDLWIGEGSAAYKGPPISKPIQPQQANQLLPSGKKPIALQLYMVTSSRPSHVAHPKSHGYMSQVQYIILAENEFEAKKEIEIQYKDLLLSCELIPGPFKSGTILMRKEI